MPLTRGIGKQLQIGVAKESTRGTANTTVAYWLAASEWAIEERFNNAVDIETYGVIEDNVGQTRVKNLSEGELSLPLADLSTPLLFLSIFGTDTPATHSGESVVYDHVMTVAQSVQHQSLTFAMHDPIVAQDYVFANSVVYKANLAYELGKFVSLKASVKGLKGATQSAYTPSQSAENRFVPQYLAFYVAPTAAGVNGTLTATGTAATTIHVTGLSINTSLLRVGMTVTGTNVPVGAMIATIVSGTAFDLSAATTGAVGTMTFGGYNIKLKSAQINIESNVTDDDVLGSTSPRDFLNQEFKVEGQIECIWQNESDFKTGALANLAQAMRFDLVNSDVTIGTSAHPEINIVMNKVVLTEFTRPVKIKDIMYQTVKFKAAYSVTDAKMITVTCTNTVSAY